LALFLMGTLHFCHGVFGALHLVCYPPQCAGDAEHPAEHQAGAMGDAPEHPADHGTSLGYFAVLVGLVSLLLRLLPKGATLWSELDAPWPVVLRWVPAVFRPPPTPTPLALQVFRL
jgi:hypothetical protein